MNYVYCTDLKNYQVLGTFLELLYYLKVTKNEDPIPMVIVGTRDADKIPALKKILSNKLDIENGIYKVNNDITINDSIEKKSESLTQKITNIKELQLLEYNNINIGPGIASSLISKHRCTEPDLKKLSQELNSYTQQSILFLESFQTAALDHIHISDTIYIYNGRHYNTYPQSLFCEQLGCNILYYERMNSGKNLTIQKPRIHDFLLRSKIANDFWINATDKSKIDTGHSFFQKQEKNTFSKNNDDELLVNKPYIVYFPSSEDEYASLDERISLSTLFKSQRDAVQWLAAWASSQEAYQLVIRLHPNQKEICQKDYSFWHNKLNGKNVTIIPSHSNISSYKVALKAKKVVSFLSTMGVEATYMGIPSITVGNPIYKGFDAVYEPQSPEQLHILLEDEISPKEKENTLPFGYYNFKYGQPCSFYKELSLKNFEDYGQLFVVRK
ncbi:hypothetical protein J7J47_09390 [Halomonas sp. ISL-60]|uniref:capsular polysaccharide export protein, LipB/KpsS family n=1 Tax=Halomonas sp. ISL-56 TaxID=2819149 RepID=UPI001BE98F07|nr:hypothetical protein [Halomonas sp. ISL-56]MBT2772447.1 hypothetical protein [Halomonas sp. ISL-60]MBT2803372.1 hypothetical protein [Halomonas sp. ISL-56]